MLNQILFYVIGFILMFILFGFIIEVFRLKTNYSSSLVKSMLAGLFVIPCYLIYFFTKSETLAYVTRSLYYALNSWLTYYFVCFSVAYGTLNKNIHIKRMLLVMFAFTVADSILMVVNIFNGMYFNLNYIAADSYWKCVPDYSRFIAHLSVSYGYILVGVIIIVYDAIKSPFYYKFRYLGILFGYVMIITAHIVCTTLESKFDISVLLYAAMGGFVSYFTTYFAPHQLITHSLSDFNNSLADVIVYFDDNGKCVFANRMAHTFFRKNGIFSEAAAEQYRSDVIMKYVQEKNTVKKISFNESVVRDGNVKEYRGEYQEFMDQKNAIGSYFRLHDVTEALERFNLQKHLATHDPLTGLYSRERFFQKVDEILEQDPDTPRLMLCSNIIEFKTINEILGTNKADEILIKQAQILETLARADDVYCRIADDKFAIFMRSALFDPKLFEEGFKVLQKLTESESFRIKNEIGVCEIKGERESAQILLDKALLAIENKTDNGRVFYFYNSDFKENQLEEHKILGYFDKSLESGDFELNLQPIFNKRKEIIAAEVLPCWNHPKKGRLVCSEFENILEKYGVLYRLDEYIWEESIKNLSKWESQGGKDFRIMLKISSKDYYYIDIYSKMLEYLGKYDFTPGNVVLEFYEETISRDFRNINELFKQIQGLGIKILINKFGNGYSTLNLLKDTHCDMIKVSSSFVENQGNEDRSKKILEFIVNLSNVIGTFTIIDGIEEETQLDKLRMMNFGGYQGNYLDLQMSVSNFETKYMGNL